MRLVKIRFNKKGGYTITAEVGRLDEIFALNNQVILFKDLAILEKFIMATKDNSNFKDIEEQDLTSFLATAKVYRRGKISYPNLLQILNQDPNSWTWRQSVTVLDALNMLSNICITRNRFDLEYLFHEEQNTNLYQLLDYMDFMAPDDLGKFPSLARRDMVDMTARILTEVEQNIFVLESIK
jgi:hypothetical protein